MSPLDCRRSRSRHALAVALLAAVSVSSCGGADKPGEQGENRSEATTRPPSPARTSREPNAAPSDSTRVEKAAPLPRELSVDGAPAGHDPVAGDIGYWAPDGDLVLYYDDAAPHWNGIVRLGASSTATWPRSSDCPKAHA